MQGQPIFEENDRENFKGIDIMRTVRSFDPCLPCGVHMYLGEGKSLDKLHSPTQTLTGESEPVGADEVADSHWRSAGERTSR